MKKFFWMAALVVPIVLFQNCGKRYGSGGEDPLGIPNLTPNSAAELFSTDTGNPHGGSSNWPYAVAQNMYVNLHRCGFYELPSPEEFESDLLSQVNDIRFYSALSNYEFASFEEFVEIGNQGRINTNELAGGDCFQLFNNFECYHFERHLTLTGLTPPFRPPELGILLIKSNPSSYEVCRTIFPVTP
jgi:hypothetical protein